MLRRAAIVISCSAAIVQALPVVASFEGVARAQGAVAQDPYKQHMENGVKLFNDGNYEAAIAEFQAAYEARPKYSPLNNVALCHKALFRYPKAIAALELALQKHTDTMTPEEQQNAKDAIRDMSALLGLVTIRVRPDGATLVVDGEEQPKSEVDRVLALGPGTHKIEARAPGFVSVARSITVVSGKRDQAITIELDAEQGKLVVVGAPGRTIVVDERVVGDGTWSGALAVGKHKVSILSAGAAPFTQEITIEAGKEARVELPAKKPSPRGIYLLATGTMLFPTQHPKDFPPPNLANGGAGGLRAGYRVNVPAAFELLFEYGNIFARPRDPAFEGSGYTLQSIRVGGAVRLMSPGKLLRFVGGLGGGLAYDWIRFKGEILKGCATCLAAKGVDPFVVTDVGAELDIDHVLIGLSVQAVFQSSRGLEAPGEIEPFDSKPLIHVGPSVRVGYAFW